MSQKKSTYLKSNQDRRILETILWFMENYLPQKKKRSLRSEFQLGKFESFTIKKIRKLGAIRSKSLGEDLSKTKVTFTVGNWALPYLNLLKRIRLLK